MKPRYLRNRYSVTIIGIIFIVLILNIFLTIYSNSVRTLTADEVLYYENSLSAKRLFIDTKCSPINSNFNQYKVILDGIEYPKSLPRYLNYTLNFKCLNSSKNIKTIFLWNSFFQKPDFDYGLGKIEPFIKNNCPVTNCEITNDLSRLYQSEYVLVHMRDYVKTLPSVRPPSQKWIFVLYESPVHSDGYPYYNGYFNSTSTYKRDSEFSGFYESYSMFTWKKNKTFDDNHNYLIGKSGFSAAIISNCDDHSDRLGYINQLSQFIPVSIFGKCGNPCPMYFSNGKPGDCKEIIGKEYLFYFAFENSICREYITEKFFEILKYDIIPVVMGGGSYSDYIPKSGFINIFDYATPEDLSDYLKYLANNQTAYNSYFKWKKHVNFFEKQVKFSPICEMCIQLNLYSLHGLKTNTISDIDNYWNKRNDC